MAAITAPLIAILALGVAGEDVKLHRTFKASETDRYSVSVTIAEDSGQTIEASADVIATVKKVMEDGRAEISRSMEKLVFKVDGQAQEMPNADIRLDNFDKNGMPESMEVDGPQVVYVIQAFSGFSPNATVPVAGSYDIKWKAADDSVSIKGKGTLSEVVEIEGSKYAKLSAKCTVVPNDDHEGEVTYTSWVAVDGGKLLKAEGTVQIEGTTVKFKVDRVKPKA